MEAYCVKCKSQRTVLNAVDTVFSNGRHAKKGKCNTCSGTVCKIVSATAAK